MSQTERYIQRRETEQGRAKVIGERRGARGEEEEKREKKKKKKKKKRGKLILDENS